jgi:hypothetical protein
LDTGQAGLSGDDAESPLADKRGPTEASPQKILLLVEQNRLRHLHDRGEGGTTANKAGQVGTLELTKQRDGVDGTRWGFTSEPVDVSDGKRSFVVVPADTPTMAKSSRWSRGLTVFREAVQEALLAHGQDHRPAGNGSVVKAVAVEDVRAEHNRLYVHAGDGAASKPSARLGAALYRPHAGLTSSVANRVAVTI